MAYIYTIFRDWPQKLFQEFINHFVSEESIPPFRASSKQSDCYLQLFHAYYIGLVSPAIFGEESKKPPKSEDFEGFWWR
jgi:hypothetical protein